LCERNAKLKTRALAKEIKDWIMWRVKRQIEHPEM